MVVDIPTINGKFPWPLFKFANLLEWLTELKKIVYSLNYWFIVKVYNSGAARWKRCLEQSSWEEAQSFHAFPRHAIVLAPPHVHHLYPTGFFWRLYYTGWLTKITGSWWLNLQSLTSPWTLEDRAEVPNLNHMVGSPGNQPPFLGYPGVFQKSPR